MTAQKGPYKMQNPEVRSSRNQNFGNNMEALQNLPGPGLPLYKIQCAPRDCRYKMQNQVKFCHYKMQIYPTWIFGTKFSGDATCWSTACNLHFVPKPTSTLKNMYHLLPPMRFAFCTELWLAVIQDEPDQFTIFLGPYLIFNNSKWN